MTIDAISSTSGISQLDPLLAAQASQSTGASTSTSTEVSGFASVLNELQQLQQNDPAKFQEVTASVAKTLETDASSASGRQAEFLSRMAGKFEQASQTGTMSALQPPSASGHHGGHHHHHSAVQSYASQQQSTSTQGDPSQQTPFDLAQIVQSALDQAST